jgi:hypothetical protein
MKTLTSAILRVSALSAALLFFAEAADAAFISAASRIDMVHDPLRNVLYISSGSSVLRYDLASKSFLTPVQLSGALKGIDLSPDGNTLAVADSTRTETNVWIHLVNLNTLSSQQAFFPRAFYEGGTYSVAWGADGAVIVSGTFEGSGWVPLRRYQPTNGTIQEITSIRQSSMLSPSADRTIIGIEESNISNGPVERYGVAAQAILTSGGTGWFNYEVGVSRDGTQVAAPTYGGTFIFNAQMQLVTNLGVYAGQQPIGVAYHPTKDAVFFAWAGTTEVRVFDTYTFSQLGSFFTSTTFSAPGNAGFVQGRLKVSSDGLLVFVTTSGGIDWFTNNLAVPEYRWLAISGSPKNIGSPTPQGYATNAITRYTAVTNTVASVVDLTGVRYQASGAALTGATPILNLSNKVAFVMSNNVSLVWNWQPAAYLLSASAAGAGSVNTTGGWFNVSAVATVSATPTNGARFVRWLGDLPDSDATNNPIFVTMNQPRTLIATFAPTNGSSTSLAGGWPTFGNGSAHTGYVPGVLGGAFFSNRWSQVLGNSLLQVAVGGGQIYAVGWNGTPFLAALQESSGQKAWQYSFASAFSINPPTYDSGAVFVQRCNHSSDTQLWSIDANTGQVKWSTATSAQWESYMAPTIADGKVWVNGGYYGGMYGFTETNGVQLFFLSLEQNSGWTPAYANGKLYSFVGSNFRQHDPVTGAAVWSLNLGQQSIYGVATPVLSDDLAFLPTSAGLAAVNLSAHQLAWQAPGSFQGFPAVANGIVYAISNSTVAAFSIAGQYLASYTADTYLQNQPIVTQDALIVASSTTTYVFDLFNRQLRQTIPFGGQLSLANGVLYIASSAGELRAMSSGNDIQFVVAGSPGGYGSPQPNGYGTNWFGAPLMITNQVSALVETNLTRYQCSGWTGIGNVPATGTTNFVTFALNTNSILTWQWTAVAYQLIARVAGPGTINVSNAWYSVGQAATLTATPSNGFRFVRWVGDVPSGVATNSSIILNMTQGRQVTAVFGSLNQGPLAGDWPTFGNGPAHAGYFPGIVGNSTFALRWRSVVGGSLQQAAVGGNRIYVTPYQYFGSAFLTAIHEYSGQVAWQYNFASAYSINPPTYDSGSVYVQRCDNGGDTHLWNFNAITGGVNWQAPHGAQWERYMAPTVADGGVWVNGGTYGGMYGFNQSNGSQRFFLGLAQVDGWTPAYYQGKVYTQVGMFRAHDPVTGAVLWSTDTSTSSGGNAVKTPSIADGRGYFIGSPNLFAVDLTSHAIALRIDGNFTGYPAIANGMIYAISNNVVAAYSTAGQYVGSYVAGTTLSYQPIVTDDSVIVSSATNTCVFDLFTFALKQSIPVAGYLSLANGVLYITTSAGELYSYSSGPDVKLTVAANGTQFGSPAPFAYGTNWIFQNSSITSSVPSPVTGPSGTRYVVSGWTGTGSTPPAGVTNTVSFTITNDSTLTWLWKTQYFLATAVNSNGSVNVSSGWFDAGSVVNLTATPSNYFHFTRWQDGVAGTSPSVSVTMNAPLLATAIFDPNLVTNNTPTWWLAQYGLPTTDAGALADTDGDGLPNWREFQFGTHPLIVDTDGDGYGDGLEVARGSNPANPLSIPMVQVIIAGSPTNYGAPQSLGYGTNFVPLYALVTNTVPPTVAGTNGQRFVSLGWTGTADVPASGPSNTVVFMAQTNSTLTWLWQMQFQLTSQVVSNGTVTPAPGWFIAGTNLSALATPATYFLFDHWTGDLLGTSNPANLTMNGPKSITAYFTAELVTNGVPKWWLATNGLPVSDAGALADTDGDGLPNWQEFQYQTNPNLADTDGDGYNDGLEVARGSSPTLASSIPRVNLTIASAPAGIGSPQPQGYGIFPLPLFGGVTNSVASPVYQGASVRYQNLGWIGSGDVPASGAANQVAFNLNTNSTLTWQWQLQYALTIATNFSTGNGFVPRNSLANLLAPDGTNYDGLGWSVAVDGDVAIVGAPFHQGVNPNVTGGAYIYRRSGNTWSNETFLDGSDSLAKSFVGCSVSVFSNRVAIGALTVSGTLRSCSAYVYSKSGSTWIREAVLSTGQPAADWDAWGLSLNQNFLAIGASADPFRGSLAGSVFVYYRNGSTWPSTGLRITPADFKAYQFFGSSVAAAGTNLLVVGAPGDTVGRSYSGAAYVFRVNNGQSFTQEAKFVPTNVAPQAEFGASVSAIENLVAIGAPSDATSDIPSGAAYIYSRTNAVWTNTARLTPSSNEAYTAFGQSVAVGTNRVMVGAPQASGSSTRSGSAWIYQLNGAIWQPQSRLQGDIISGEDQFGWSVALSADSALVGAIDNDQRALDAGAALVFNAGGPDGSATWWNAGGLAFGPTAPDTLSQSNLTYRFVGWELDGIRQAGPTGPINPLTGLLMNSARQAFAIYLPETEDTDGDSLPDWWERRYLGTLAWGPADDPDHDGFMNWQEWMAGTNPFDATSALRLSGYLMPAGSNAFMLQWPSVSGRSYRVYSSPTPAGGYSCISSNIAASPPVNAMSIPRSASAAFFRVQLE